MALPVLLVLAAALVPIADDGPPAMPAMEAATLYGRTLGAAAQCPGVDAAQLQAAAERASAHLKSMSPDAAQTAASGQRLSDAVADGAAAVRNGEVTCAQATADFVNLERELAP